jgi:glycosyltransferase involved in cell wall biosynthesis
MAMKVLQVSPAYFPALSFGGPIMTTLALNRLLCRNHQVTTLTTPLGLGSDDAAGIVFDTPLPSPCGSELIYQPYSGYQHFTWSPASLGWLRKNARQFDVVMLQGVWNFPLMAAAWVCQQQGIPYLVFPHGTLSEEAVQLRSGMKKRIMLAVFVRRMLERAARIVFTTPYEVVKVQSHLRLDITPAMIPNIVDDTEFLSLPARGALRHQLGIAEDTTVLLHLGRVAPVKRLTTTVSALAQLRANGKPVALVVVGGDESGYQAAVTQLATELGVTADIYFTGLLGRDASKQALVDADIFVLPSMSENFGMAVAEAMLARLPVVISDNVGLAQDVAASGAGLVVPLASGDTAFAAAIAQLIDDPLQRTRMGEAGRALAKAAYSEAAVMARMEMLLNEVQGGAIRHAN